MYNKYRTYRWCNLKLNSHLFHQIFLIRVLINLKNMGLWRFNGPFWNLLYMPVHCIEEYLSLWKIYFLYQSIFWKYPTISYYFFKIVMTSVSSEKLMTFIQNKKPPSVLSGFYNFTYSRLYFAVTNWYQRLPHATEHYVS